MLEILQILVKKMEDLKSVGIVKDWKLGTLGYNGALELEFQGEIVENEDSFDFCDYIMIDEEAVENLESKFKEITEAAKDYFEIEV